MNIIDEIPWGGASMEKVVYDFILKKVAPGSTVVELGGGECSTRSLGQKYNLYTIEHDNKWLNYADYTTYIHAPISDGWYDRASLKDKLPTDIKMVLVDGPSGTHPNPSSTSAIRRYKADGTVSAAFGHCVAGYCPGVSLVGVAFVVGEDAAAVATADLYEGRHFAVV